MGLIVLPDYLVHSQTSSAMHQRPAVLFSVSDCGEFFSRRATIVVAMNTRPDILQVLYVTGSGNL